MTSINFSALVLAGSRGDSDPVAQAAGLPAKALLPIGGRPMLLRVVDALTDARSVGHIDVVGLPAAAREQLPTLAVGFRDGRDSPVASVEAVLSELPAGPVLVTTADHALLGSEVVDAFLTAAAGASGDVVIGLVRHDRVRKVSPDTRRTVMRFRDGEYCGCNLYAFMTAAGRDAVGFWSRMEQRRKHPARIALALGVFTLMRYFLRRLTLGQALDRLSSLAGARIVAVDVPFGEAAIDVDKPEDIPVAEALAARH